MEFPQPAVIEKNLSEPVWVLACLYLVPGKLELCWHFGWTRAVTAALGEVVSYLACFKCTSTMYQPMQFYSANMYCVLSTFKVNTAHFWSPLHEGGMSNR